MNHLSRSSYTAYTPFKFYFKEFWVSMLSTYSYICKHLLRIQTEHQENHTNGLTPTTQWSLKTGNRSKNRIYFPKFYGNQKDCQRNNRNTTKRPIKALKRKQQRGKRLNTSRPDKASQREIGSTALSSMRFWRRESFLRLESWPIRGSKVDNRFDVRSNSVRVGGNSNESRSWSWKLVRSRTVEEGSSWIVVSSASGSGGVGGRVSSSIRE